MKIDGNEKEMHAMELFREGKEEEAKQMQKEFLQDMHNALRAKEIDVCTCTATCELHGKCLDCVAVHRGHKDHLPKCLHNLFNEKLLPLSALSEHSLTVQKEDR